MAGAPSSRLHRARGTPKKNAVATASCVRQAILVVVAFVLGCAVTASVLIASTHHGHPPPSLRSAMQQQPNNNAPDLVVARDQQAASSPPSVLDGVRVLVAIASFDFSQFVHLEEVLDSYHDLCAAGAKVDVVVHETQPWPVALIDLLNTRLTCTNPSPNAGLSVTVSLRSPSLKLNLVDCHRKLFYDRLDDYDIFIYSEDDIRVTPKTVAAYIYETSRVQQLVGGDLKAASDFNVGIVRYEYNFPPDVVINDKTRHAVENTTRVYWEHSWHPAVPKSVDAVEQPALAVTNNYVHMKNHHQGMFLATRDLLKAWRDRPGCNFDVVRQRPGMKNKPSQPTEGTQRVWMSSQMLHGGRHCNVQQVLPVDNFGQLTVLHLPNKNYRRVGKKGRLGGNKEGAVENEFADGTERIEGADPGLLTAMQLHVQLRRKFGVAPERPPRRYVGIDMVDDIERDGGYNRQKQEYKDLVERRLKAFNDYVSRGGVMVELDMEDQL